MAVKIECSKCGGTNWEIIGPNLQCSYCGYVKGIKEQAQESLSSKDAANLLVQKSSHKFTLVIILISLSIIAFIVYKIVELIKGMITNDSYLELLLPMLFIGLPIIVLIVAPVTMTIVDTISTIIQKNNGVDVEAIAESRKEMERIKANENIAHMKSLSGCSDEDFIAEGKKEALRLRESERMFKILIALLMLMLIFWIIFLMKMIEGVFCDTFYYSRGSNNFPI